MSTTPKVFWAGAILFCLVCVASAQPPAAPPPRIKRDVPVEKMTVEQLIDALQDESEQGIGTHATAWASGFIGDDEPPRFGGGVLGSQKPLTSSVMRELVRRGPAALPKLLEHVDDKRPTRFSVGGENRGIIMAMWHADEYDPRFRDPKKHPEKVNSPEEWPRPRPVKEYTVKVGDLCFVAIGQIVNRNLNVLRYQPTACLVFNSPVETPALAAAVRKDWTDLTAEEHKQSLVQDAFYTVGWGNDERGPVRRLLFYYPKTGEELAAKMLARPIVDHPTWKFASELLEEADATKWAAMVAEYRRKHGDALADSIPSYLLNRVLQAPRKEKPDVAARVEKILAKAYPGYDPYRPPFVNVVSASGQDAFVRSLVGVRSEAVDAAVLGAFRTVAKTETKSDRTRYELDQLAFACIARLARGKHDDKFRAFLNARAKACEADDDNVSSRARLIDIRKWQARLRD